MFVQIDCKITDNYGVINYLVVIINKDNNIVPTWGLYSKLENVAKKKHIKKGGGNYQTKRIILDEWDTQLNRFVPYARLLFEAEILNSSIGDVGKFIDVNGNIRRAEFLKRIIVEPHALLPMAQCIA